MQSNRLTSVLAHISRITAVIVIAATTVTVGPDPVGANEVSTAVPVVHIDGRGHGHGVGMSQWGAFTMANGGSSAADIMAAFYPGTTLAERGGEIIVGIHDGARSRVGFPGGGQIHSGRSDETQAPGFPVTVAPGQVVEVVRTADGIEVRGGTVTPQSGSGAVRYSNPQDCLVICPPGGDPDPDGTCHLCIPTTTSPPTTAPPTTAAPAPNPPPGPPAAGPENPSPPPTEPIAAPSPGTPTARGAVWAVPTPGGSVTAVDRGRSYRGTLEIIGSPAGVRTRNHVDIEDYLKGMAEVPSTWPAAAVQAQAIAARTYALRAVSGGGELCDTESCQVYVGTSRETPGQSAAVDATRNVVVTYDGGLAATFYSATGGGYSATAHEGFGSGRDVAYLQAKPYPDTNPQPWGLDIALTDVAARLGYGGTITDVRVSEIGPSGRAVAMALVGTAGTVSVDPQDFRRRLGLRSTLFSVSTTEADRAPAPPPPPDDGDANGVVGPGFATNGAERSVAVARVIGIQDMGLGVQFDLRPIGRTAGSRTGPLTIGLALLVGALAGLGRWRATMAPWRRLRH